MTPKEVAHLLELALEEAYPSLQAMSPETRTTPLAPGKWSPQQVMGHLIDSAANNHQRFVRVQQQENFIFKGYQQDQWVIQQAYEEASWETILNLWTAYNRHLAHVIRHLPQQLWAQSRHPHNLHQIAFKTVPEDQPTSLAYFVADYIAHLEHHLKGLIPGFSTRLLGTSY
ncbi:MAG: DinB family protein [Bacteroidota bacterium]